MSNQSSLFRPERRIAWQKGVQPPGTTGVPNQTSNFPKRTGIEIIREIDGDPELTDISILEVPNGSLSNPSPGIARIDLVAVAADGGPVIIMGHDGGVPPAVGIRFLRLVEGTNTGDVGFCLTGAATLIGLTVSVDFAHPTNTYTLEMLSDPTGKQGSGPTVIGSLVLAPTVRKNQRQDLSVAIAAGLELGSRIRRTSGSGNSNPIRQMIMACRFLL